MLAEIENAIIARIKGSALGQVLKTVDSYEKVMEAMRGGTVAGPLPGVFVKLSQGNFEKTSQLYSFVANWTLFVIAQDLRGRERNIKAETGAYAIIEALLSLLTRHQLGIEITPLVPKGMDDHWDEDLEKQGIAVYGLNFQTSFVIESLSDEAITDLLRINVKYYLQDPADDSVKDAEDQITL